MSSDFSPIASLLQALETLSKDQRLDGVFGNDASTACSLHLWLLELTQAQTREYRLLLGQVIPATFQNPDRWNISEGGKQKKLKTQENSYKFRIAKLTIYHNSKAIFNLIKGLCQGFSLDESCDGAEIVRPIHNKNSYGQLRLTESSGHLAQSFAVRPVVFLETRDTNRIIVKELQPAASPIENVPAFAGSLCRLNKLSLFSKNAKEPLPQADDLARECLSHLAEETGLNFRGADSKRLGNIEWLCFPAMDEHENSQVKIIPESSTHGVEIQILAGALSRGTHVVVRCCLRNDQEVILDQCKTAQITETDTVVNFQANQKIIKILVTIWIGNPNDETCSIWYEDSYSPLQQIGINLGVVSLQGKLKSDWLEEFGKSKICDRVEKAQAFKQVNSQLLEIGGYQSSPWIAANHQIHRFTQQIFPKPSGGRFFQKGWDADAEEPGRLSFFEWLQSLTKNHTDSKILIVDPYFDTSGIVELVARAEATQAEYVVLANTQVKSDDDALEPESDKAQEVNKLEEPQRATRLIEACEQLELLLTNLKFRLLDLRSKEGGRKSLFHDRYILVFDEFGKVKTGYHLSNSIQGATKKHPLLVTPIPGDVLIAVEDYVSSLLSPADNSPTELITLFSSANRTETPSSAKHHSGLTAIPHASLFFATLLQDNRLLTVSNAELASYLQNNGLFIEEGRSFAVTDQIDAQLNYFVQVLIASSAENFVKLWTALASWLAQLPNSEEYLNRVMIGGGENLALKIKNFLSDASSQKAPIGSFGASKNQDSVIITNLMLLPFREELRRVDELLMLADSRSWYGFSYDWGIQYGAQALAQLYPKQLVTVVSQMWHTLIAELRTNENTPKSWVIADTVTSIIKRILNQLIRSQFRSATESELLPALLRSDVPLLRAIGVQSLAPLRNRNIELQNTFAAIDTLPEIEGVIALAEWVFKLRVRANVNNHEENTELKELRLTIFDKIRQVWPANLQQDELRDIVCRLSGPIEGDWAVSTNNELLLPLVQENKLTIDEIAQLWLTILFERLKDCVSATEQKQAGESSRSYFFAPIDRELTDVSSWAMANAANASVKGQKPWY